MCGISGVAVWDGPSPVQAELRAMSETLIHRGPDDHGYVIRNGVGLGIRRLAVIDIDGGQQPIFNEDESVAIVFNGEIYNYRDLRGQLEDAGHQFRSDTDGEVIAHLWEEFGTEFAARLNGMFAIALHDSRRRRLVLVRDRLGIKPLFFHRGHGRIVFGSEIKAVLANPEVPRQLDAGSVAEFLSWEYVPSPRTFLKGIKKIQPGGMLDIDLVDGTSNERTWWDLPPAELDGGAAIDWEEAIDAKVKESVQRQLVSDVPVGAFLSGGVDSSLVVSGMGSARTFSIGFEDPSYNELRWSQMVARHLGVDHTTEVIRPNAVDLFDELMPFMDDPIADFSIFPTYLVSKLARQDVTVVLSGDGGDEIFGGYETYVAQQQAAVWQLLPAFLRHKLLEPMLRRLPPQPQKKGLLNKARRFGEGLRADPSLGHARWRLFTDQAQRTALFTPDLLAEAGTLGQHIVDLGKRAGPRSEIDRSLYVDTKSYLSDNCLVKVDRMSMACSLEARVPLLDHELVELAFRMPALHKVSGRETKPMLKRVAARHLPRQAIYRSKEGFSVPIKSWLGREFRPLMEELLAPAKLGADGLIEPEAVDRLKREHLSGRANHSHILWGLIVLQDWRQRWSA